MSQYQRPAYDPRRTYIWRKSIWQLWREAGQAMQVTGCAFLVMFAALAFGGVVFWPAYVLPLIVAYVPGVILAGAWANWRADYIILHGRRLTIQSRVPAVSSFPDTLNNVATVSNVEVQFLDSIEELTSPLSLSGKITIYAPGFGRAELEGVADPWGVRETVLAASDFWHEVDRRIEERHG